MGVKCEASQEKGRREQKLVSENEMVELQDRHPTSGAHMNCTNDDNIARLDAAFSNAPTRARTPNVWLATL
jgi:hypothetical protein